MSSSSKIRNETAATITAAPGEALASEYAAQGDVAHFTGEDHSHGPYPRPYNPRAQYTFYRGQYYEVHSGDGRSYNRTFGSQPPAWHSPDRRDSERFDPPRDAYGRQHRDWQQGDRHDHQWHNETRDGRAGQANRGRSGNPVFRFLVRIGIPRF